MKGSRINAHKLEEPPPMNWSKDSVFKFAEKTANKLGYKPGKPLKPIIEVLGGRIVYQDLSDWAESGGLIVYGENDFEILISNFTSGARDQFTIAHELGHYIMHSQLGKHPCKVGRKGSDRLEWEANWFAAGFLMPEKRFREVYSENSDDQLMAYRFGVSPAAIRIRKKALGL